MLTIQGVTKHPELLAASLPLGDGTSLQHRPLRHHDVDSLERFLDSLSPLTRERWMSGGYEPEYAAELCDAIGRFDKLRMILLTSTQPAQMVGIFEFSFGIPESDFERFKSYGIELEEGRYARFGPCLRDDYQGRAIASLVMPHMQRMRAYIRRSTHHPLGRRDSKQSAGNCLLFKRRLSGVGRFPYARRQGKPRHHFGFATKKGALPFYLPRHLNTSGRAAM